MKKILLIIVTTIISNNIIAQINLTDFAKYEMYYWKLRGRLLLQGLCPHKP